MKILSLSVDSFLRIEALEIVPKGNTVTITGKNDQGKSSTLRALDVALGGGKAPEDPVHRGANKAEIVVQLGDEKVEAIVKRTYIKRDGKEALATLTVTTPEGAKWPKPQEFLDKVLGSLSLDPVKFLDMKPEDQAKVVRAFVPGFDFAQQEKTGKEFYETRTDVNREIKRLEAEIASQPTFEEGWPEEMVDTSELVSVIEGAVAANASIDQAKINLDHIDQGITRYDEAIAGSKNEIAELKDRLRRLESSLVTLEEERQAAVDKQSEAIVAFSQMKPIDVQDARDKLYEADQTNDKVRDFKQATTRRERLQSNLDEQKAESLRLTKLIEDGKVAAAKAIAEAKMPVNGLGFDEEGKVTINGFPLANTSFSRRLLAAIAIAAAHAPTLRLVKISDGDKLDDDAQKLLSDFAEEHDLQIWQETVQHGAPVGFVIEDGKLKGYAE